MAENNNEARIINPKYKGKPENFKADFKHPNAGKKSNKPAGPRSKNLPPPSNTAGAQNPTPTRDEPIFKDAIFGPEIQIRENNMRTTFQPSAVGLIPIINDMWLELRVDEQQIDKQMLIEGLRYYGVSMLWLRIIQLKQSNNILLTTEEQAVMDTAQTTSFNVPEPLFLYLKSFGTVKTSSTGQTLIPTFPDLPVTIVNGQGGYYGIIDDGNHNLYEEIPCLGVVAEAVRMSLSDALVGRYASSLDQAGVQVNSNLLGFEPLVNRRPEAKNFFLNLNITDQIFGETIPNTSFNYDLILAISQWISTLRTFKNQHVVFENMGENGSQSQTVIQRPLVDGVLGNTRNSMGEVRETSLSRESTTTFGLGYFTLSQLYKEPAVNAQQNESIRSRTWCCQNFSGNNAADTIPNTYIVNRNDRRTLPPEYLSQRFETISMRISDLRKRTLRNLVISKRNN